MLGTSYLPPGIPPFWSSPAPLPSWGIFHPDTTLCCSQEINWPSWRWGPGHFPLRRPGFFRWPCSTPASSTSSFSAGKRDQGFFSLKLQIHLWLNNGYLLLAALQSPPDQQSHLLFYLHLHEQISILDCMGDPGSFCNQKQNRLSLLLLQVLFGSVLKRTEHILLVFIPYIRKEFVTSKNHILWYRASRNCSKPKQHLQKTTVSIREKINHLINMGREHVCICAYTQYTHSRILILLLTIMVFWLKWIKMLETARKAVVSLYLLVLLDRLVVL